MQKEVRLSFPVVSFRNLETPFNKQGYRNYFAVVATDQLPDLTEWRKINVRDPKLTGAVPNAIRSGFQDYPDMFLFMNRGLVLSAQSVSFDNNTSTITINLRDPSLHGLLDGGHTYYIVREESRKADYPQFLKMEILAGLSAENVVQVVDARNTSNQVQDESLLNLQGKFEDLKRTLKDTPYFEDIAFQEYQLDRSGKPKPIDIRDIIAMLTAFDRENFNDSVHPIKSYSSKAACLKHFEQHLSSYRKIYPLARDILALHDHIYLRLPVLYNVARGQSADVSGGKFGKLTGCSCYSGKKTARLYFIGEDSKYAVPSGFVYPILGAFRALLEEKAGVYVWGKNLDPVKLLEGDLGLRLADTIGAHALDAQNPSKTGKAGLVWQACYRAADNAYLRAK